jgi:type IV secretory pathway VirB10-like protein
VILVRISARLVLAGAVVVMVTAGAGVALSMPGAPDSVVAAPELTAATEGQESEPAAAARPVAPPITGAQIAALAATPARERAAALIAERQRAEEAERARQDDDDDDDDDQRDQRDQWDELRDEIRQACNDGRIRGAICRST